MDPLQKKLAETEASISALLAKIDAEQAGEMTEADETTLAALMDTLKDTKAQIAKKEEARAALHKEPSAVSKAGPVFYPEERFKSNNDLAFEKTGNFESLGEFAQAVFDITNRAASALPCNDPRMEQWHNFSAAASSSRGTPGLLVPQQYAQDVTNYSRKLNQIVNLFTPKVTATDSIKYNVNKKEYAATNGVQSYYGTAGSTLTETNPDFEEVTLPIHKQHVYVTVESEVLSDAPRLNQIMMQDAPEAIARLQSRKIFDGMGVNEPLGFMHANNGSLISQAKKSGQAAATIVSENINQMYARLANKDAGAFWLASPSAKAALGDLTIGQNAAYLPVQNPLTQAYEPPLKGLPVIECDFCAVLGTVNDLILVQPKGYELYIREGVRFDTSMHIEFNKDKQAFRWILRNGGGPTFRTVYTPEVGDTRSYFITLATRA